MKLESKRERGRWQLSLLEAFRKIIGLYDDDDDDDDDAYVEREGV